MSYSEANTPRLADLEEGATKPAATAKMDRRKSSITILGIDANHPALIDQDPAVQEMALKIIDDLDLDKDGTLDSSEVLKGIVKAAEANYSVKQLLRKHNFIFGGLACVILLLCLSTLGTSVAAALLTKETHVSADGNMKVYGTDKTVKTLELVCSISMGVGLVLIMALAFALAIFLIIVAGNRNVLQRSLRLRGYPPLLSGNPFGNPKETAHCT
mmetsp:Transcript_11493/g.17565  ORF Transcript_11493/g.17565 Transcript_11493/m.17565 type:complete len:215 (-) Transcript_11493:325-969(-)|eukprot:CAMPEP_0201731456 /NCGR_PEP_ID=MMETSP0593-20130828/25784_1 /ASSEMBLY_ACC=CAM_ASM_000672 /TAXON_ID=267983 /ORGANISM="Skeletonema japonicum, Strain CCMP2506" /LENGTH=214 /DNA_ID=CAMNT_0048224235 /DNA_START=11 /DNA_END=655 /DNA_ORIENTATION=-